MRLSYIPLLALSLSGTAMAVEVPTCDPLNPEVKIIQSASDFSFLNNPSYSIFCVVPGDWTQATNIGNTGILDLMTPGTEAKRRYLLYGGSQPGHPVQSPIGARARIGQLRVKAPYWVIHGMTVYGRNTSTGPNVMIQGVTDTIVDYSIVEGNGANTLTPGEGKGGAYLVSILPNSHRTKVTRNVIRNTAMVPGSDRICVNVLDSHFVEVGDNEIYDCASNHIQLGAGFVSEGSSEGAQIWGNSIYETGDTYCGSDESGSETGIDVKSVTRNPGAPLPPERWVRIFGNSIWGLRVTNNTCGATGTISPAFLVYNHPSVRGIEIHSNAVWDSPVGIIMNNYAPTPPFEMRDINIHHNVFADMKTNYRVVGKPFFEQDQSLVLNSFIWANVSVDNPSAGIYEGGATFVDNAYVNNGPPESLTGLVYHNHFFATAEFSTVTPSHNIVGQTVESSNFGDYCVLIKQWTAPQTHCIARAGAFETVANPIE